MRTLKIVLSAPFLILSFASLLAVTGCKKTTTYQTRDSVYYSPWIKLAMTRQVPRAGDTFYTQTLTASKLTAAVIRSGAVISYLGSPYNGDTLITNAADYGLFQFLDINSIQLQGYGSRGDYSYTSTGPNGGLLYRYVVIPGNVLTTTSLKNFSKDQLNKMKFTDIESATH